MKASDTADTAVLQVLAANPKERHTFGVGYSMLSVAMAFAENTPPKVQLAKMRSLIKRGLVDGCACGCRGDFVLTDKAFSLFTTPAPKGFAAETR